MIKTTAPYHLPGYKTLELVVESEPISSSDNYDPISSSDNYGSESLNNVFRIARQLPICAIVENTWHKCVEWFY
jgi:hypothetical protein